jgi:hypothetical protein
VLTCGQAKRLLKAVWGTLMACRQLSDEMQPLMMKLCSTIALHDDTEGAEVHNMLIPSRYLPHIKKLKINIRPIRTSPALLDLLPKLEVV